MRLVLLAVVVTVVIAGALCNAARDQQRAPAPQTYVHLLTDATATVVAAGTTQTVAYATRDAERAAYQTALTTQVAGDRASFDATVTARQASAQATSTALARR